MMLSKMTEGDVPNTISQELIRECIVVKGAPEKKDEKRNNIMLREVQEISFSFKNIQKINNLQGLDSLTKLQLDNNIIDKIVNLGHLVNLTWLDLSFNNISKIEGLEKLTKLTDLSLCNNRIETIEGLDTLTNLNVLSLGNNLIRDLTNVMYLRKFKELRLINLSGNPIAQEVDYKAYVISHLKYLTYLDYRRIYPAEVQQAREQFQDEVTELEEQEKLEAEQEAERQVKEQRLALMRQANLDGIETLDLAAGNEEYRKLSEVEGNYAVQLGQTAAAAQPGHFSLITESAAVFKEKYHEVSVSFVESMLREYEKKKAEHTEFQGVIDSLVQDRNGRARDLVATYEKKKKHILRDLRNTPAAFESKIYELNMGLDSLQEALMEIEVGLVECLKDLCAEFDRNYTELADLSKNQLSGFFSQARELEQQFFESVSRLAMDLLEKANTDPPLLDLESLPEDARRLITDKDSVMNAVQACHDQNTAKIDALEDRLTQTELKRANDLVAGYQQWAYERNRSRIAEIWSLVERHRWEIEELESSKDEK